MAAVSSSAIVGALACQKNSFLKTLRATVVACKEYQPIEGPRDKQARKKATNAEPPTGKLYAVELDDTVLFPEGGGQPHDTGTICSEATGKIPVQKVLRQGLTAVHVTPEPLESGAAVTLEVDWKRRLDIMQQHTGQHLISAVFDTYDLETLGWSMGDRISYIELPRRVEDSVLREVGAKINQIIVDNLPITVSTPDSAGGEVDTSHIPGDYDLSKGILRVVSIGDFDKNPCCGTHLTATGQVQAVALLHQINVRGGNSKLHFACGSRVPALLQEYHGDLKEVSGMQLSCQIEEVTQKVAELSQNYRKSQARESALLRELSGIKAREIFARFQNKQAKFAHVYREDTAPEYFTALQKELATLVNTAGCEFNLHDDCTVAYLSGDHRSGGGMVKVTGPKAEEVQRQLKELIGQLKGGGKGSSFQGKVTKYDKGEVESVLRYFESMS